MKIRIQHFRSVRIRLRIQGFDDQNLKKYFSLKKIIFFKSIIAIYPLASIKDVQASKEAFSLQKTASSTNKLKISKFFLFLWVNLLSWILPTKISKDPDPENGDKHAILLFL